MADLVTVGRQHLEINFAAVVMSIPCIVSNSKTGHGGYPVGREASRCSLHSAVMTITSVILGVVLLPTLPPVLCVRQSSIDLLYSNIASAHFTRPVLPGLTVESSALRATWATHNQLPRR